MMSSRPKRGICTLALCIAPVLAVGAQRTEADYVIRDFRFASGETLPELRIHYTTLGHPHRSAAGTVDNAVLMLHGTTGSGTGLVAPMSSLFRPGDLFDTTRYFVVPAGRHRAREVEQAE